MSIRFVEPLEEFGADLLGVEKPARYVGGEYGAVTRKDAAFRTAIAFPDLYEIGMSNQALKILYKGLNRLPGVFCDRAFTPAPDFEALLRERGIPLYGLDTGIALGCLDLLCFTLGYELGITGVLTILEAAHIPLRASERGEGAPLIIMGGPCVSNPRPYEAFIDAFWIGEAEAGFFELVEGLAALKGAGEGRGGLLSRLAAHPHIWLRGKARSRRAVDSAFAQRPPDPAVFPVPSMKIVQHHGVVELMRGCPNGCRFCHAGYWYRPMRQKSADTVREEIAALIETGGFREISLSSLSTGDYRHIDDLAASLNAAYASRHISFQLPSLRVSTFSLPLLEAVSEVRKSGLTFAVETPTDAWQLSINKEVSRDQVVSILREAKKQGWRGAKFYFMVGLPLPLEGGGVSAGVSEEEEIVDFIMDVAARTGMHFHINAGAFIPKPHTPYQWAPQISETEARRKLDFIRSRLKARGHKVGIQDPFVSTLEGIISRGDERVGELIEAAYRQGCRLDAWTEYFQRERWAFLIERYRSLGEESLRAREIGSALPWDCIDAGVTGAFLAGEGEKSLTREITSPCIDNCTHPCGNCRKDSKIVKNNIHHEVISHHTPEEPETPHPYRPSIPDTHRILFSFSKTGKAVFLPHLGVIEIFSMAFIRSGIPVLFTGGFNPLPRLDFASPLAMGITGEGEIASLDTTVPFEAERFQAALKGALPQGFSVTGAVNIFIPGGVKKHSLASLLWGYEYETAFREVPDLVKAKDEKAYRLAQKSLYGQRRKSVLARASAGEDRGACYFTVYRSLYGS
ncbi:MAG: TIGR03936 family radical SAM-associated protein [Spirochaetaceae bacterium]|jgi:radical SAM-linked protein|nr:TIGR03936 family radical SAM-associated protein [Spirochaetaceae bacterium]